MQIEKQHLELDMENTEGNKAKGHIPHIYVQMIQYGTNTTYLNI